MNILIVLMLLANLAVGAVASAVALDADLLLRTINSRQQGIAPMHAQITTDVNRHIDQVCGARVQSEECHGGP